MLAYMILCGRLPFGTEKASVSVADLYSGGVDDAITLCRHLLLMCRRAEDARWPCTPALQLQVPDWGTR